MSLTGRHALVTGGSRGIGAAIARALTEAGARVTILGRDIAALRSVVTAGHAEALARADVTRRADFAAAVESAVSARGPIDILVSNAGSVETAPFLKTDPALFARMIEVHLIAAVHGAQLVLPAMKARRSGRIINIASTAALKGFAYGTAYTAAKHALLGLTRALALETAAEGVTVNALCPGYAATDLVANSVETAARKTGRARADVLADFLRGNPLGRLIEPREIAAAALFLCSDAAAAVTGQAIAVDGGETM